MVERAVETKKVMPCLMGPLKRCQPRGIDGVLHIRQDGQEGEYRGEENDIVCPAGGLPQHGGISKGRSVEEGLCDLGIER